MKPKPPLNESKKERFKRLAEYRTNEVLGKLKVLGNCANRQGYEYTEEEVKKIFDTIDKKIREIKSSGLGRMEGE